MEAPFREEMVKEVMWSSARDKSVSLKGFNIYIFKTSWDILKDDIINFVNGFHSNTRLPRAVTSSFLAFIPKSDSPISSKDYRSMFDH